MENLISIIILLTAIPLGYFLKYLTKEEIKPGKKYFHLAFITSFVLAIIFLFIEINDINTKKTAIISLFYISIVSFISWK